MKVTHLLFFSLMLVACSSGFCAQVRSSEEAIKLAVDAIHHFELTTLKDECGVIAVDEKPSYFDLVVRERHTPECGGTSETGPRLFSIRVSKQDGRMSSDIYDGTCFRPLDHRPKGREAL